MSGTSTALRDSDIVILVMGFGGSRRSSFINALLGAGSGQRMRVGVTPERACTTNVDHVVIDPVPFDGGAQKKYRLVLVDTPGLDAPNRPDSKVYGQIAEWSRSNGRSQTGRAGVIFLHDLTSDRFEGECHHTTTIGQHLNIAVVTSKWDYCQNQSEARRRHELLQTSWKQPPKRATFHAFQGESDAWEVVRALLSKIEADRSRNAQVDLWSVFEELKVHWGRNEGNYTAKKSSWRKFLGIFGFGKKEGEEDGTRKKKKDKKRK